MSKDASRSLVTTWQELLKLHIQLQEGLTPTLESREVWNSHIEYLTAHVKYLNDYFNQYPSLFRHDHGDKIYRHDHGDNLKKLIDILDALMIDFKDRD